MNSPNTKPRRLISLGACVVDAIMKVEHIPGGDAKAMASDGMVIGAGMAVAAACAAAAMGGMSRSGGASEATGSAISF